jgi:hypothetical protein
MSINVSSKLLQHANSLNVCIDTSTFTDRQLKGIAKQVLTGALSDGNSATATIARYIAEKYDTAYIRQGGWWAVYKGLEPTHPWFDAITEALAITKLEQSEVASPYYKATMDKVYREVEQRKPCGQVQIHWASETAHNHMRKACMVEVPSEHIVREYLNKLIAREIKTLELSLLHEEAAA